MKIIDHRQLKQLRQDDETLVINVLPESSFHEEHIPDSINIPYEETAFVGAVETRAGSKERPIVVYCASEQCDLSPRAAQALDEAGFAKVHDYEGGVEGWKRAGERVESD